MHVFKIFINYTKEEKWLNEMSKKGYEVNNTNFGYTFASSYFVILTSLALNGLINLNAFINPKELYFTPGLWESTGLTFWIKFLFETPFALGRGFLWLIFPIFISIYLYCILKASKLYKETIKTNNNISV